MLANAFQFETKINSLENSVYVSPSSRYFTGCKLRHSDVWLFQ